MKIRQHKKIKYQAMTCWVSLDKEQRAREFPRTTALRIIHGLRFLRKSILTYRVIPGLIRYEVQ